MKEKCIIIGCEMLRDEIEHAYRACECTWPIVWISRKYHNTPEKLKVVLQETIDRCQEYDRIILTFGCCGGGTDGLVSQSAEMTFIACEDCIHMLLYSKQDKKSSAQKGIIYITKGWTQDEQSIVQQYIYSQEKYGKKMCGTIMKMMYGNFHELCVIDTGAYELSQTVDYAKTAASVTNLKLTCCNGTTELLQDLFCGSLIPEMLSYKAGQIVKKEDF